MCQGRWNFVERQLVYGCMKTIASYAGIIAGLWTLLGVTFAVGFVVGRGVRRHNRVITLEEARQAEGDGTLSVSTQELAIAQFSKAAWLSRPQM